MSEKPEALRLAENLENPWWGMTASPSGLPEVSHIAIGVLRVDAARMIRDQRDKIERLKAALPYDWDQLEACRGSLREHMAEIKRLREALEGIAEVDLTGCGLPVAGHIAHGLIGRAKAALRREETT